jgi:diguanylate cyclase (GGDEF)-like protein
MKRIGLMLLAAIYFLYAFAVITVNNVIGDLLSPVLTLVALCFVCYGFVIKEKSRIFKLCGVFYSLSLFFWFLLDFIWGLSTLVFHVNPENNLFVIYGYSATNLFLFLSLIISGYMEIRKLNKIQVILDTLIISICITVFLWVFIFNRDVSKANTITSDYIFMFTSIIDIIILGWTSVWYFSTRTNKSALFVKISAFGGLLFVISDLIYNYQYFYASYQPNSLLDGGYMLGFTFMAASGYVKSREICKEEDIRKNKKVFFQLSKEVLIITMPVLIFIFKKDQSDYIIILVISILLYYVLSNYTQKIILQEKLLLSERNHVIELEEKVEERTKEIVRIMNTDIVTGLYNRRYFEDYINKAYRLIEVNEFISLLYIDINKYTSIKSLYGKFISEELLKDVGEKINNLILKLDHSALFASYGEDVFVLTMKGEHMPEQAYSISEEIISQCTGRYNVEEKDIFITLNIGLSCYPLDTFNHEDLIKNAESAMIYARKMGSNKAYQFNENIGEYVYNRNNIEVELKKVNFNKDFSLYYQPQVACDNGEIIGAEALLRWQKKNGMFIPPKEFIPITEESGQIIPLGYWIIENAARQLAEWREFSSKEIRMAVNVSAKQLREKEFVQRLKDTLIKYHIPPELFEIEITENIQLEGNTDVFSNLNDIKDFGVSIAIDDFGTGYSSLFYLKNIPINRIKIAKELVDNIENDLYSHSIIRMLIEIAKSKDIKVIAEGVEFKEQWECLKDLNCNEIQGYYFAKPITGEELQGKWLVKAMSEINGQDIV